jgi:hypothetical protein
VRELDVVGIVHALNARGVRYVVIGGVAAMVHDLPVPATVDIDVTPARDPANLGRLAAAFDDLDAGLLTGDDAGTWFPRHPTDNWAQYDTLHLITNCGALDVVFTPDGAPAGYDDLAAGAEARTLAVGAGRAVAHVVPVETWVELKQASGRPKDLEHLDRYHGSS